MEKLEVEIGIKLNKDLVHYHNLLIKNGFTLLFPCSTKDIYFSKLKNFENLTENEIKDSCKRVRFIQKFNTEKKDFNNQLDEIKQLELDGYDKVLETTKFDFQYEKENSKFGCPQLQIIENIGLVVYYDNKLYYGKNLDEQRKLLIDDLNEIGFNISYNTLGIDKLKSLILKTDMFSKNQNG